MRQARSRRPRVIAMPISKQMFQATGVLDASAVRSPKRIQRKRTRGWRMPGGCIFVGRGTIWGNPFKVGEPSGVFEAPYGMHGKAEIMIPALTLAQCVEFYESMVRGCLSPEMVPHGHRWYDNFKRKTRGAHPSEWARACLRGKDLACWCGEGPCHANVLLEIANG